MLDLVTKQDLDNLKQDLLAEIKSLLAELPATPMYRQWMKASEVRAVLKISAGKLQTLRTNGLLKSTKIGGTHYFRSEDISRLAGGDTDSKSGQRFRY